MAINIEESIYEVIPDNMKCPVCLDMPEGKVFQCKDGHILCEDCYLRVNRCPQCRIEMGWEGIRNRHLEFLLDEIELKCPFQNAGCTGKFNRKTIKQHLLECSYKSSSTPGEAKVSINSNMALIAASGNGQTYSRSTSTEGFIVWVTRSKGSCAPFAVQGGMDSGNPVYVARACHAGGLIVGKLIGRHSYAQIPYDGKELFKENYELLTASPGMIHWVECRGHLIPMNALIAGKDPNGDPYYIGRVTVSSGITVGKIHHSLGKCCIAHDGRELAYDYFEILVVNGCE